MICKKCGNMYNENESMYCPKCRKLMLQNRGIYVQTAIQNGGKSNQPPMMLPGVQYQCYAGKYYPGLSKKELFKFQWLRKYNTAIMILSVLMYVFQSLMLFSFIYALKDEIKYMNMYHKENDIMIGILIICIAVAAILLMYSFVAHMKKSRAASGFVMILYILCLTVQFVQFSSIYRYTFEFSRFVFALILPGIVFEMALFGLSIAVFILTIIYNSKWNSYRRTGIIPM